MLWIKIALCILIVAFCTLMGYFAAGKYRARKRFYSQFCTFNERYLNELGYARRPLSTFLQGDSYTGEFGKSVGIFLKSHTPKFDYSWLKREERTECCDYFATLGKGDVASQKSFFTSRQSVLSERKAACEREAKSRGDLYLKLGILAGLAFVILII